MCPPDNCSIQVNFHENTTKNRKCFCPDNNNFDTSFIGILFLSLFVGVEYIDSVKFVKQAQACPADSGFSGVVPIANSTRNDDRTIKKVEIKVTQDIKLDSRNALKINSCQTQVQQVSITVPFSYNNNKTD